MIARLLLILIARGFDIEEDRDALKTIIEIEVLDVVYNYYLQLGPMLWRVECCV
jgi:hypothetical protein